MIMMCIRIFVHLECPLMLHNIGIHNNILPEKSEAFYCIVDH